MVGSRLSLERETCCCLNFCTQALVRGPAAATTSARSRWTSGIHILWRWWVYTRATKCARSFLNLARSQTYVQSIEIACEWPQEVEEEIVRKLNCCPRGKESASTDGNVNLSQVYVRQNPFFSSHEDIHLHCSFFLLHLKKMAPWSSRWFEDISVALIWLAQIWVTFSKSSQIGPSSSNHLWGLEFIFSSFYDGIPIAQFYQTKTTLQQRYYWYATISTQKILFWSCIGSFLDTKASRKKLAWLWACFAQLYCSKCLGMQLKESLASVAKFTS